MLNFFINHQEVVLWPVLIVLIIHVIWLITREERRTRFRLVKAKPRKLILFCYDPRFFEAVIRFIYNRRYSLFFWLLKHMGFGKHNGLGLKSGQFITRKEAGGPVPFAYKNEMPKRYLYLKRQLLFALEHFKFLEEIVLIGHEDCKYYGVVPNPESRTDREREDLPAIARAVKEILEEAEKSHLKVSIYYARIAGRRRNRIEFDRIDLE